MSIGTAIRAAREARGWSQPDLAAKVGVARETVSRWETGALAIPQLTRMGIETVLGPLVVKDESKPAAKKRRKS